MVDFIVFISTQFFKLFEWLDSITIYSSLSLLKILIIFTLFVIAIKFLSPGGDKK